MLKMLFINYTNISPSFIVILNNIQEKQQETYFLICINAYDDVINPEIFGFMKNAKI